MSFDTKTPYDTGRRVACMVHLIFAMLYMHAPADPAAALGIAVWPESAGDLLCVLIEACREGPARALAIFRYVAMDDLCEPFRLMKSMTAHVRMLLVPLSAASTQDVQAQYLAGFEATLEAMTAWDGPAINTA
jgi:hypothetical protein